MQTILGANGVIGRELSRHLPSIRGGSARRAGRRGASMTTTNWCLRISSMPQPQPPPWLGAPSATWWRACSTTIGHGSSSGRDEANVDRRRAEVGLPPLAEYLQVLSDLHFPGTGK